MVNCESLAKAYSVPGAANFALSGITIFVNEALVQLAKADLLIVKVPLRPMMLEEVPSPKVTEVIVLTPLKALPPIEVTEFGIVSEASLVLRKQLPPIVATEEPKVTLVKAVSPLKALSFKVIIAVPVLTLVRAVQALKQLAPNEVRWLPRFIVVRPVQLLKAFCPRVRSFVVSGKVRLVIEEQFWKA